MKSEPLSEQKIRNGLTGATSECTVFHILNEIHSTSCYLKALMPQKNIQVCAAESQTHGRGRFGRQWDSPPGQHLYLSVRLPLNCALQKISGISLITGLAVLKCLDNCFHLKALKIKWPNDILWQHKKLCGILIETTAGMKRASDIIIGIGLNVNQRQEDPARCSLLDITGRCHDRNALIAEILTVLLNHLHRFLHAGLSSFMQNWQESDYLFGQHVKISTSGGSVKGVARGINKDGQLCLEGVDGEIFCFSSGEASLKPGFVPGLSNEPGTG